MRRKPIGLITATPFEAKKLLRSLKSKKVVYPSVTEGLYGAARVVHAATGIGIANAAHGTTVMLERYSPALVLLFGMGGAYPGRGLNVGDIVLAEKEIYADSGVLLRDRLHGMDITGIPLLKKGRKKYFNEFPVDGTLLKKALKILSGVKSGVFLTVAQSTGIRERAEALGAEFDAVSENMEGASVAQICLRYGVPFLEARGISNIVEDRSPASWDKALAADNCQRAVGTLLSACDVLSSGVRGGQAGLR